MACGDEAEEARIAARLKWDGGRDAAMLEWGENWSALSAKQKSALCLLYHLRNHRRCLGTKTQAMRLHKFKGALMILDLEATHSESALRSFEWTRLSSLVDKPVDEQVSLHAPFQTWDNFLLLPGMDEWDNKFTASVLFQETLMSYRRRISAWNGTYGDGVCGCFGHAEALTVHYTLCFNRQLNGEIEYDSCPSMPDLTQFMTTFEDPDNLWRYIESGRCGDSARMLTKMAGVEPSAVEVNCFELVSALEKWGPVLVSGLCVTKQLLDPTRFSLTGPGEQIIDKEGFPRRHSMVLVGHRIAKDGVPMFLLQNCFPTKQFLEVDVSYLEACGAKAFCFTDNELMRLPGAVPYTLATCISSSITAVEM